MNTLITGLIISGITVVFVNIVLFGFIGISIKSISFGTLFLIQAIIALFILFMYLITKKKG